MIERTFHAEGIPLLALASATGARPAVLFYHGLQSNKETHRRELTDLAERGFLAVGVDAVGHGERKRADLSAFLNRGDLMTQVTQLLRPTANEIPFLVDLLEREGYGPIGLAGISFGGMVAFGAVPFAPKLRAVVAILGDPRWCNPEPAAYAKTALFAWNAGRDQHVDPKPAREFMTDLHRSYPSGSFLFREYPASDHFMEPADWSDGWNTTLAWFDEHLRAEPPVR